MSSSQTRTPTAVVQTDPSGWVPAWSNPAGAIGDGSPAAVSPAGTTRRLTFRECGFDLPANALVQGVTVELQSAASELSGNWSARDFALRLLVGGQAQLTNRASGTLWPTTPAWLAHGGPTDTWGGLTLSPAQINDADFGIEFEALLNSPEGQWGTAYLSGCRITVHYEVP